ncbi:hypothetical protein ACQJBY_073216 [Aegilops geniculata]
MIAFAPIFQSNFATVCTPLARRPHISFFNHGILSYTYLHRPTAQSSLLMATTSCWFLVFVVCVVWRLPLMLAGPEEQLGENCPAKRCGSINISHPLWIPDWEAGRSCGPLDFAVNCNNSVPVLKSYGLSGFAIMDISYDERSMHVVDTKKENDFNVPNGCHFPLWNTSAKLAPPFKVSHSSLNLIFYNCTRTLAHRDRVLVELSCADATNAYARAAVRFDKAGNYGGYALEQGCNATVVPVASSSGKANASDYKQLIRDGFLMTWDLPPLPAPVPLPTPGPTRKFTRRLIF